MSDTSDQVAAKQRFLDLKVGNVDLVDEPANLVDFVAKKSMEGSHMSNTTNSSAGNPEGTAAPATKAAQPPLNATGTNVSQDLSSMVAALNKACSGGGMKVDDEMKKGLTALSKALSDILGEGCEGDEKKKASKSSEGQTAETEKAGGKQFNKERMDALTNSVKALLGVIKAVDENTYKALTAPESSEGTAGAKPLIPTAVAEPNTQKALEDLSNTVKALTETMATVSKKLEAVDAGSTKTEPDNGTEVKTTKSTSLWSGVL